MVEGREILVVEDEDDVREAIVAILTSEGYRVRSATHGAEAIDQLRAGLPVSLILLDLMMPTMDGWEFRVMQRQDPALAGIPVVVMSGYPATRYKAAPLGAIDYLEKPVDAGALLGMAERYC